MHDNPYESPAGSDSVPKRRRPAPPPILHYAQIVGTAAFFGALAGLLPVFPGELLLWFLGATALSLLLALSVCVFLELRRREEERKAAERPLRDIQAWRRH